VTLPPGIEPVRAKRVRVRYPDRARLSPVVYRRGHYSVVPWFDFSKGRYDRERCNVVYSPPGIPLVSLPLTSDDAIALAHLGHEYDPVTHAREACRPFLRLLANATRRQWACKLCGLMVYPP
jgi:hypothetical protein